MTCSGCANAVDRALKRLGGTKNTEISVDKQEVIVDSSDAYDTVLSTIQKTGKEVKGGEVIA